MQLGVSSRLCLSHRSPRLAESAYTIEIKAHTERPNKLLGSRQIRKRAPLPATTPEAPVWFVAFDQKFDKAQEQLAAKVEKLSDDMAKLAQEITELKAELTRQQLQGKTLTQEPAHYTVQESESQVQQYSPRQRWERSLAPKLLFNLSFIVISALVLLAKHFGFL